MSLRSGPAGPVPVNPVGLVPVGPVGLVPVGPVGPVPGPVRFRSVRSVRFRSVLFFYMSNCRVKNAALGRDLFWPGYISAEPDFRHTIFFEP